MNMKKLISVVLASSVMMMGGCGVNSDDLSVTLSSEEAAAIMSINEDSASQTGSGDLAAEAEADETMTLVPKDAEPDAELAAAVEEASKNATAVQKEYDDIRYASQSASQVCDIKIPEGDGKFPVIVVIHGGGFVLGDKEDPEMQPVIDAAIAHGYAAVNAEYRGYDEANFPGAVSDIKGLIRFIKANADEYQFDPDRIIVWGASAGGYLAAMTALTSNVPELSGDVTDYEGYISNVQALVDYFAPLKFTATNEYFQEVGISPEQDQSLINFETAFLGFDMNTDLTRANKSWWGTYVDQLPPGFDIKVWISHGTADTNVPYSESTHFARELQTVLPADRIHLELFDGANHTDTVYYTPENLEKIFQFLAN